MRMVFVRFLLAGLFITMTTMVFVNSCQLSSVKETVNELRDSFIKAKQDTIWLGKAESRDTVIPAPSDTAYYEAASQYLFHTIQ